MSVADRNANSSTLESYDQNVVFAALQEEQKHSY